MKVHYPTKSEPATPEYVLSVYQDVHRQQCQSGDADPAAVISFDMTIAEWRNAFDLLTWRELGRGLNEWWGIAVSDDEWRSVLTPPRQRRLSDVCALIARHASRRRVTPARLVGKECNEAGAFLTIRSLLDDAGASVEDLSPSCALAPYSRRYHRTFLGPIARLAPGALPEVKFSHPVFDALFWLAFLGPVLLIVGGLADWPYATIAGVAAIVLTFVLSWIAARWILPRTVQFGSLQTFRDLSLAITRGRAIE